MSSNYTVLLKRLDTFLRADQGRSEDKSQELEGEGTKKSLIPIEIKKVNDSIYELFKDGIDLEKIKRSITTWIEEVESWKSSNGIEYIDATNFNHIFIDCINVAKFVKDPHYCGYGEIMNGFIIDQRKISDDIETMTLIEKMNSICTEFTSIYEKLTHDVWETYDWDLKITRLLELLDKYERSISRKLPNVDEIELPPSTNITLEINKYLTNSKSKYERNKAVIEVLFKEKEALKKYVLMLDGYVSEYNLFFRTRLFIADFLEETFDLMHNLDNKLQAYEIFLSFEPYDGKEKEVIQRVFEYVNPNGVETQISRSMAKRRNKMILGIDDSLVSKDDDDVFADVDKYATERELNLHKKLSHLKKGDAEKRT